MPGLIRRTPSTSEEELGSLNSTHIACRGKGHDKTTHLSKFDSVTRAPPSQWLTVRLMSAVLDEK